MIDMKNDEITDNDMNDSNDEVLYFDDDHSFEREQEYGESVDGVHENPRPVTNTNSVEYDEEDYESESVVGERKKVIFSYLFIMVVIVLIIIVAIINLK